MGLPFVSLFLLILTTICIIESQQKCQEWELAFRAVSGNGESVLKKWKARQHCWNCVLSKGCLPRGVKLDGLRKLPNKHLKSPMVDEWSNLNIQRVKIVLYDRNGRVVRYFEFNGRGSTFMNWFHRSRLIRSSWTDLSKHGSFNHFSVTGEHKHGRHFYVNRSYGGCPRDYGWFVVMDKEGSKVCRWEKMKSYPQFMYSAHGRVDNSLHYRTAEIMNVYIKRA